MRMALGDGGVVPIAGSLLDHLGNDLLDQDENNLYDHTVDPIAYSNPKVKVTTTMLAGESGGVRINGDGTLNNKIDVLVNRATGRLTAVKTVGGVDTGLIDEAIVYSDFAELIIIFYDGQLSVYYANLRVGIQQSISDTVLLNGTIHETIGDNGLFNKISFDDLGPNGFPYLMSLYKKQLTIDSTKVSANHTDFAILISVTDPKFIGNARSDGGDFRVTLSDTYTKVPLDVVSYDGSIGKLVAVFKGNLSSTIDSVFYIHYGDSGLEAPAPGSTYGSQNAWNSTFQAVYATDLTDRTANARVMSLTGLEPEWLYDSVSGVGPAARQMCTFDGSNYFFADNNDLFKRTTITGSNTATNTDPCGDVDPLCDHLGAGEIYGDYLYITVEAYTNCTTFGSQHIARFNKSDLTHFDDYDISAQGYEVSALTIDPDAGTNGIIYITSFCDGSVILRYDLSTFAYIDSITIDVPIDDIQGICLDPKGGFLISSSDFVGTDDFVYSVSLDGTNNGIVSDSYSKPAYCQSLYEYNGDIFWWDGVNYREYMMVPRSDFDDNFGTSLFIGDSLTAYTSLAYSLPETGTISYVLKPRFHFNFNTLWDNSIEENDWESWTFADGRAAARVDEPSLEYDLANIHPTNSATFYYYFQFNWDRDGSNVDQEFYIDGSLRDSGTVLWVAPGTFHLAGGNAGNANGCSAYQFVTFRDFVVDSNLSLTEHNNYREPSSFMLVGRQEEGI